MTDEQRIKSIKKILDRLNHPIHKDAGNSDQVLVNRTKHYTNLKPDAEPHERFFAITGKDIVESGRQWSCGTVAKAFCYLNSQLPKSERLDVQIMISTHPDHLIDSRSNHTLPCVKMGDGKWYAIEPQKDAVDDRPRHPMYPDLPLILDDIRVGNIIHHIKPRMLGIPYEITAVMSWQEYEEKCSDFGTFLKYGSKLDKKTRTVIAAIETVLRQINRGNSVGNIYTFCKALGDSALPVKILCIQDDKRKFNDIAIKIKNSLYGFHPNKKYCYLHEISADKGTIISEQTPAEYVKSYNENIMKEKTNGKVL
jgi:hypothetical protein